MDINLATVLDEIIVLHSGVATKLLNEFPDAFGATFMLDSDPAFAFAKADVPSGYAPEYRDEEFQTRSAELLREIAPRMHEIMESVTPIGIKLRDLSVNAQRGRFDSEEPVKEFVHIVGAFSGGVGAVVVRRAMLATNDRVLGMSAAEFHIIGIVEDRAAIPAIEEAASKGLRSGLDHLSGCGLLLNHPFIDVALLHEWADHFPVQTDACAVRLEGPVCRLIAKSEQPWVALYVVSGTFEDLDKDDNDNIKEYDPVRGFDIERHRTAIPGSDAQATP